MGSFRAGGIFIQETKVTTPLLMSIMTTLQEEDELFGASLSMDFYLSPSSASHRPWLSSSSSAPRRQPFELLDDVPPATFHSEKVIASPRYPVDELYPSVDEIGNGEPDGWYDDGDGDGDNDEMELFNANTLSRNSISSSAQSPAAPGLKSRYPIDDECALDFTDDDHYYHSNTLHSHDVAGRLGTITETRSESDSDISEYQPMNRDGDDDNGDNYSVQDSFNNDEWQGKSDDVGNNRFRYAYDDDFSVECDVHSKRDDYKIMDKASIRRNKVSMSSFDGMYNDEMMELDIPQSAIEQNDGDQINQLSSKPTLADEPTLDDSAENHPMVEDVTTPTPTNRWTPRLPERLCETTAPTTSVVTQTVVSLHEVDASFPNATLFPKTPSCSSFSPGCVEAILVTPPQIYRTSSLGNDIFRINGTDSGLSSVVGGNIRDVDESTTNATPPQSGYGIGNYSLMRASNEHTSKQLRRREDPPDTGFGYYPQRSVEAKEPEGYKQQGLFPDIQLWTDMSCDKSEGIVVPGSPARKIAHAESNEECFPGSDCGDYADRNNMKGINAMHYDDYARSSDSHGNDDSFPDIYKNNSRPHQSSKGGFKSRYHSHKHSAASVDDMFLDDEDSSSRLSDEISTDVDIDGVSVISEESEIGMLDKQQYHNQQLDQHKRQQRQTQLQQSSKKSKKSYYQVKRKDSMESDLNIDFTALSSVNTGSKSGNLLVQPYSEIKQSDSMEKELSIDFDEHTSEEEYDDDDDECSQERPFQPQSPLDCWDQSDKLASPPMIHRKPFSFDHSTNGRRIEGGNSSEFYDDNMVRFTDFEMIRSVVSDKTYSSVDDDDGGKSETSNKPTIYQCKAMSQMNERYNTETDNADEWNNLWKIACDHLARGRNNDALFVLTDMLQLVQRCAHDAKIKLQNFHFQKDRDHHSYLDREELENQLDSALQNSASAMANVLNNIGVVLEVKGEYQLAMNSYQDALDMYRSTCRRYENAGDREVDRTVNNIMSLGIAMRNKEKRMDLHIEAEKLAEQIELALHSENHSCTELRMERLNVLMCVLDLEAESLGHDHPDVGFTLLKKGALHLEMMHVDMAIKDTRDAVAILKKGLGSFHPEVGFALVKLGDMFNYDIRKYGGGLKGGEDCTNMALSLYREALMPLRESFGTVNPHSGLANNCIGILYSSKGEVKHAMSSFYDALASYGVRRRAGNDTEAKDENFSSHPDVFFVWVNVGCLHMSKKEWQLALRSYLKAQSAFRCLSDEEKRHLPPVASSRLMKNALALSTTRFDNEDMIRADILFASLLQNIGKAQSMLHRFGNAIDSLEEALQIHQVFMLRTAGTKQDLYSYKDMARILENLGDIFMVSGDLTSAFTRYIESLNLLRSSAHVGHSSIEIALVLGGIGQVHLKKGEYSEAKVVLKESMRMFEKIGKS